MSGAHEGNARDARDAIVATVRAMRNPFVAYVRSLAEVESPTDRPDTQARVQHLLCEALEDLGFRVRHLPGRGTGGHLLAVPAARARGRGGQLLIGHTDTVWPVGTLAEMPVHELGGKLHGPGTLDMKGGLAQMVFALRALRALGLEPPLTPVVFINSDEETGSADSRRYVERIARRVRRAWVLEPALEPGARLKTARKGILRFDVVIHGRASHAGLNPEAGASAVLQLAHVVQQFHALNEPSVGRSVNVGVVEGGTRANVVAARAYAAVDARVATAADARVLEDAVAAIRPSVPGVSLHISGGLVVPPLERTPRNRRLWSSAVAAAKALGFEIGEGTAGGGSDGNTTSRFTATLDGLGCVGDGAHASHEHIDIDASLDRCALLAGLLMAPDDA